MRSARGGGRAAGGGLLPWLFLAGTCAALGAVAALDPPPPRADDEFRIEPHQGAQLGRWLNPNPEGFEPGWILARAEIRKTHAVFTYAPREGGPEASIGLHHVDAARGAVARTARFALTVREGAPPPALVDAVASRLRDKEAAWTWREAERVPAPLALRRLLHLQVPVAVLLLLQLPVWAALATRRALAPFTASGARSRLALGGALAAGALLRWVVAPHRLVMLYIGYQLTAEALALQPIPRYGAGVPTLHHALLALFGADHAVLQAAHAVIGVLSLPLAAGLAARLGGRGAGLAAAWLLALLPGLVAHDVSEANTVPILWWLLGAGVLLLDALDRRASAPLVGAAALAALAMISRPEMLLLAPLVLFGLAAARRPSEAAPAPTPWRWLLARAVPLGLAVAVLVLPQVVHVTGRAALLATDGSLPLGQGQAFLRVGPLDPALWPAALWPFALVALLHARTRRPAAILTALAGLAFALTWIDLCPANILRVQVPGVVLLTLAEALGVAVAVRAVRARLPRPRLALAAAALAAAATFVAPARTAFAPTNEDAEEAFLREARAALPPGAILVRLRYSDAAPAGASGSRLHLHFPDYLFTDAASGARVVSISDWYAEPVHGPAFFYQGVRCWTPAEPAHYDPPARWPLREACARVVRDFGGRVVAARDVPSAGDPLHTGYYGTEAGWPLQLRLVELVPRAP